MKFVRPQHQPCLHILSRLWSARYLDPDPDPGPDLLSAQAEYQARILPAIAAQMAAETHVSLARLDDLDLRRRSQSVIPQTGRTFSACGPFCPWVVSNSTFWFSSSDR